MAGWSGGPSKSMPGLDSGSRVDDLENEQIQLYRRMVERLTPVPIQFAAAEVIGGGCYHVVAVVMLWLLCCCGCYVVAVVMLTLPFDIAQLLVTKLIATFNMLFIHSSNYQSLYPSIYLSTSFTHQSIHAFTNSSTKYP